MSALEDIAAILDDAQERMPVLQALHDEALDKEAARPRFRARVKSVLEQERSALDYLAVDITKKYGIPGGLIYYPLAQSARDFPMEMERKMPGVAQCQGDKRFRAMAGRSGFRLLSVTAAGCGCFS